MSTKKSRKRAYIPPSHEVVNRRERDTTTRTTSARPGRGAAAQRGARTIVPPKPGLKRTLKRLPIYFIMILALQYFMLSSSKGGRSSSEILLIAAAQAGIVTIAFAPIMHWLDRLTYNRYLKKSGAAVTSK